MFIIAIRPRHLIAYGTLIILAVALLSPLWSVGLLMTTQVQPTWLPYKEKVELAYVPNYQSGPSITAESAIVIEASTGTVLYAKNENKTRPIASTTKILTGLIAIERGNFDDIVTVSRRAAATSGSTIHLRAGQKVALRELVYGLLLRSGNDAAVAIAEHLAGSVEEFATWMNERARELGAVNSQFKNPHGLDAPGHYSSAYDLAVIARAALLSPTFGQIVSQKEYPVPWGDGSGVWHNTNKLLWGFEGAIGVKTGTTSGAGECLVTAAVRQDTKLIAVVLDARDRYGDTRKLLEYGFDRFHLIEPAKLGETVVEVPVENGLPPVVGAIPARRLALIVPDAAIRHMTTKVTIYPLHAPVAHLQPVGVLTVSSGETELGRVELLAARSVPRNTPLRQLWHWLSERIPRQNGVLEPSNIAP